MKSGSEEAPSRPETIDLAVAGPNYDAKYDNHIVPPYDLPDAGLRRLFKRHSRHTWRRL